MVGARSVYGGAGAEREIARGRTERASAEASSLSDEASRDEDPARLLPPGWKMIWHTGEHLSRAYKSYEGPQGKASSVAQAWRLHEEEDPSDSSEAERERTEPVVSDPPRAERAPCARRTRIQGSPSPPKTSSRREIVGLLGSA